MTTHSAKGASDVAGGDDGAGEPGGGSTHEGERRPWCGGEHLHSEHEGCLGVLAQPSCGKPWAEHPQYPGVGPVCIPHACTAPGPIMLERRKADV